MSFVWEVNMENNDFHASSISFDGNQYGKEYN